MRFGIALLIRQHLCAWQRPKRKNRRANSKCSGFRQIHEPYGFAFDRKQFIASAHVLQVPAGHRGWAPSIGAIQWINKNAFLDRWATRRRLRATRIETNVTWDTAKQVIKYFKLATREWYLHSEKPFVQQLRLHNRDSTQFHFAVQRVPHSPGNNSAPRCPRQHSETCFAVNEAGTREQRLYQCQLVKWLL